MTDARSAKQTSGPKGCLIAFAIFGALGALSIVAGKWQFDRRNAGVIEGARLLGDLMARAEAAPGASDVRALGCESAGVLDVGALRELEQRLEDEAARDANRTPKVIDAGTREPVVYCAHPATGEPSCAKAAGEYLRHTKPGGPFIVTVRTGFRETCAERFDPDGQSRGAAPSPKLPLLVSPR